MLTIMFFYLAYNNTENNTSDKDPFPKNNQKLIHNEKVAHIAVNTKENIFLSDSLCAQIITP